MNPRYSALGNLIREDVLHSEGVRKMSFPRRGATVFASGTPATQVFFLDSGLVKIERTTEGNKDLLLGLVAPGEVFGEQALLGDAAYTVTASMMESGTAWSYYLTELAKLTPATDGSDIVIHISQNELASLVGATRETTSTTLNSLARQGLISLGHRLVMIPSLDGVSEAMNTSRMARGATTGPVV
jgi:CRP/FNR family transcriptional regulator